MKQTINRRRLFCARRVFALAALLMLTMQAQGQIRLRQTLQYQNTEGEARYLKDNGNNRSYSILRQEVGTKKVLSEQYGEMDLQEFKSTLRLDNGRNITFEKNERIRSVFGNEIFTTKDNYDTKKILVRRYSIRRGTAAKTKEIDIDFFEGSISFTPKGGMIKYAAGEWGAYDIKIYSRDFSEITTYLPFKEGHRFSEFDFSENLVAIGSNPNVDKASSKLAIIDLSSGQLVGQVNLPIGRGIFKIKLFDQFVALYTLSFLETPHNIMTYSLTGQKLNEFNPEVSIRRFESDGQGNLFALSQKELLSYDLKSGSKLGSISVSEIYGFNSEVFNKPEYIELVDLQISESNSVFVILSEREYTRPMTYPNNLLVQIGSDLKFIKEKTIHFNSGTVKPKILSVSNSIIKISTNQNLREYEIEN